MLSAAEAFFFLLAVAVVAFSIFVLFVAWKPGNEKAEAEQEPAEPVFLLGWLHAAAATNLALFVVMAMSLWWRDGRVLRIPGAVGYCFLYAIMAALLYFCTIVKPGKRRDHSLESLAPAFIWGVRIAAFLACLSLLYAFVDTLRDRAEAERARLNDAMQGGILPYAHMLELMPREHYQRVAQQDAPTENVHNRYMLSHRQVQPLLDAVDGYLRQPKSSQEWAHELGYPFNPSPMSHLHTPLSLIDEATDRQKQVALFYGLRDILQRDPVTLSLLDRNIKYSFENSVIDGIKSQNALKVLLVLYNENDVNLDWAKLVVHDAVRAYGDAADGVEPDVNDVSCADGVAERMVIFFMQVVRSICEQDEVTSPRSEKVRRICSIIEQEPTGLVLSKRELETAIGRWYSLVDAHYATHDPRTREADFKRYMLGYFLPDEGDPGRIADFEAQLMRVLQDNDMHINFEAEDKYEAVRQITGDISDDDI